MKRVRFVTCVCALLAAGVVCTGHAADKSALQGRFDNPYYKTWPLFHFYPAHDVARFKIDHIGPIGIGLELRQPAFTMHVISVEPGSPAAATGKLKPGQIIESINGKVLKDVDPRVILGIMVRADEPDSRRKVDVVTYFYTVVPLDVTSGRVSWSSVFPQRDSFRVHDFRSEVHGPGDVAVDSEHSLCDEAQDGVSVDPSARRAHGRVSPLPRNHWSIRGVWVHCVDIRMITGRRDHKWRPAHRRKRGIIRP